MASSSVTWSDFSFSGSLSVGYGQKQLADPCSWLDIGGDNATRGVLMPRVANTSVIANPKEGLLIYDKSAKNLALYDGTAWKAAGGGGGSIDPNQFIQNQNASYQSASFKINGTGEIVSGITAGFQGAATQNIFYGTQNIIANQFNPELVFKLIGNGLYAYQGYDANNYTFYTKINENRGLFPPFGSIIVKDAVFSNDASHTVNINGIDVLKVTSASTQLANQLILANIAAAPSGNKGSIYFNSTSNTFQGYDGTSWKDLITSSSGAFIQTNPTAFQTNVASLINGNLTIGGNVNNRLLIYMNPEGYGGMHNYYYNISPTTFMSGWNGWPDTCGVGNSFSTWRNSQVTASDYYTNMIPPLNLPDRNSLNFIGYESLMFNIQGNPMASMTGGYFTCIDNFSGSYGGYQSIMGAGLIATAKQLAHTADQPVQSNHELYGLRAIGDFNTDDIHGRIAAGYFKATNLGTTSCYAIYSDGGLNYFKDKAQIGQQNTFTPNVTLSIRSDVGSTHGIISDVQAPNNGVFAGVFNNVDGTVVYIAGGNSTSNRAISGGGVFNFNGTVLVNTAGIDNGVDKLQINGSGKISATLQDYLFKVVNNEYQGNAGGIYIKAGFDYYGLAVYDYNNTPMLHINRYGIGIGVTNPTMNGLEINKSSVWSISTFNSNWDTGGGILIKGGSSSGSATNKIIGEFRTIEDNVCFQIRTDGSFNTSQPSANGTGAWKLGKKIGTVGATLDATKCLEVMVDGVVYKIALMQ